MNRQVAVFAFSAQSMGCEPMPYYRKVSTFFSLIRREFAHFSLISSGAADWSEQAGDVQQQEDSCEIFCKSSWLS